MNMSSYNVAEAQKMKEMINELSFAYDRKKIEEMLEKVNGYSENDYNTKSKILASLVRNLVFLANQNFFSNVKRPIDISNIDRATEVAYTIPSLKLKFSSLKYVAIALKKLGYVEKARDLAGRRALEKWEATQKLAEIRQREIKNEQMSAQFLGEDVPWF